MRRALSVAAVLLLIHSAPAVGAPSKDDTKKTPTTPAAASAPTAIPVTGMPSQPMGEDSSVDAAYGDPSRALGATSPSCRYSLDAQSRRACEASGSPAQDHPLSAYGIDVRVGFSLTDPGKTFMGALQSIGAGVWMGLLYIIKAVLLLLEWAFALDLTREAMPSARQTLARLHDQVFGDAWLMLAITLTGLWGMWNGLVRGRAVETLGGVAATVALLVVALVIITRPAQTVGRAAALTNDASLGVLAAGTTGSAAHPRAALAHAMRGVFDQTVRNPWCALEFGSITYCDERTGNADTPTTAALWLQYPAQSWQRDRLHTAMKPKKDGGGFSPFGVAKDVLGLTDDRKLPGEVTDQVHRSPERAKLQEAGGTFPRLALLVTVAAGMLGAAVLFAYLGLRLLLAAAMTLLLLLIAPAMLIAPALGQRGRETFIAWGQRLIGAILAKLVFAVFLTVVLATGDVFARLELGWFGTWIILGAFWWGVFLKRDEIIGFVGAGLPEHRGRDGNSAAQQAYYAWMLGRGMRQAALAVAQPATAVAGAARQTWRDDREATHAAIAELSQERLDRDARRALTEERDDADQTVADGDHGRRELAAVDRRLRGFDEQAAAARATNSPPPAPTPEQRGLLERREALQDLMADPYLASATERQRHTRRNEALTGEGVTRRDLDVYSARRASERADAPAAEDPRHLRAAGVDPERFRAADPAEREQLTAQVERHLSVEAARQAAVRGDGAPKADLDIDDAEVRERAAEHRRRIRDERRRRRAVDGVSRPR